MYTLAQAKELREAFGWDSILFNCYSNPEVKEMLDESGAKDAIDIMWVVEGVDHDREGTFLWSATDHAHSTSAYQAFKADAQKRIKALDWI